jgi:dolichol-phosphate mannosyltransferase
MISILICLPTFNEEENINQVLKSIDNWREKHAYFKVGVAHVDDNSTDETVAKAKQMNLKNYHLIQRSGKLGLGSAYLKAFTYGLENGFDYFVEFDADGSHHIEEIDPMIKLSTTNDLVIGTRWMPGGKIENWPLHRKLISKLGTAYASRVLKLPYRDLTSGFRVLSATLVKDLVKNGLVNKGYGFQIESVLRAKNLRFAIAESPITFTERTAGKSKMSSRIAFEAFLSVTRWGIKNRIHSIYRR